MLVPEAETVVGDLRRASSPSGESGMEAHVTVLAPFRHASKLDAGTLGELTAVFAAHAAFVFELTAVDRFDDGTVFLTPVPAQPFVALTESAVARFPDCPPYGGDFDAIVPHLTVGREIPALDDLPLPIAAVARSIVLVERGDDLRWHQRCTFPLAASLSP